VFPVATPLFNTNALISNENEKVHFSRITGLAEVTGEAGHTLTGEAEQIRGTGISQVCAGASVHAQHRRVRAVQGPAVTVCSFAGVASPWTHVSKESTVAPRGRCT
jgi:hypothetical protein